MKGASRFNGRWGDVFQTGGAPLMVFFKKNPLDWVHPLPTMGNQLTPQIVKLSHLILIRNIFMKKSMQKVCTNN